MPPHLEHQVYKLSFTSPIWVQSSFVQGEVNQQSLSAPDKPACTVRKRSTAQRGGINGLVLTILAKINIVAVFCWWWSLLLVLLVFLLFLFAWLLRWLGLKRNCDGLFRNYYILLLCQKEKIYKKSIFFNSAQS